MDGQDHWPLLQPDYQTRDHPRHLERRSRAKVSAILSAASQMPSWRKLFRLAEPGSGTDVRIVFLDALRVQNPAMLKGRQSKNKAVYVALAFTS